jgi:hypothetical protein
VNFVVETVRLIAMLGIKRVPLAQIAFLALGLKIVIGCLAAL